MMAMFDNTFVYGVPARAPLCAMYHLCIKFQNCAFLSKLSMCSIELFPPLHGNK